MLVVVLQSIIPEQLLLREWTYIYIDTGLLFFILSVVNTGERYLVQLLVPCSTRYRDPLLQLSFNHLFKFLIKKNLFAFK